MAAASTSVVTVAPPQFAEAGTRNRDTAKPPPDRTQKLSFAAAPALYAATWFALGILFGRYFSKPLPLALLITFLSALVAAVAARSAVRIALLPLSVAWIAAGYVCAGIHPGPDPQTGLLSYVSAAPVKLQGEVVRAGSFRSVESSSPFSARTEQESSQSLDLRVRSVVDRSGTAHALSGGVRLTLYAPAGQIFPGHTCGDVLQLTTPLRVPERYNDPGVWNAREYLLGQGIGALASAKASAVTAISAARHPSFSCRLKAIQQSASERLMEFAQRDKGGRGVSRFATFFKLNSEDASMLAAMVTGDRTWLQRRTRVGFERTGSFHLLVVSGLHLAIFAGIIFWCAQRIRLSRPWASLLTIAAALAYAVFTGFGQPVQRSFWMVTLYLLGRLIWRERSALNAIGFAALWLLAANPPALFEAGFQMTLLSVITIAGIAAPLAERSFAPYLRATRTLSLIAIDSSLPPRVTQFRVSLRLLAAHLSPLAGKGFALRAPAAFIRILLRVLDLLLISVLVEIVMSLPMALYFHRVTVLALPVNLLIVPFLSLLLPSALLTFATLLISSKVAAISAGLTAALLHSVTALIHAFANLRAGDLRLPGPPMTAISVFGVLLVFAVYAARWRRNGFFACATALALMAITVLAPRPPAHRLGALEVTALDVGQGDSLLVVTPEGKTLLIDAGGSLFGPPPGSANFDIGEEVVSAYLWSRGIRRLDAVALTHAHADHLGGMAAVLANFRPAEVWVGKNPQSSAYDGFLHESESVGATIKTFAAGDQFQFGKMQIKVLAPGKDYRPGAAPANNDSLVLRVQYGGTSALLEGDAESPSEQRMVAGGGLHSDLLKVGHHGSRSSTTPPFLGAVAPSFAVISVGARNLYGHPRPEILEELESKRVRTYRTDSLGLSTFYLDGKQITPGLRPAESD